MLVVPVVASGQTGLEKDLQLRLALGEFGAPACASLTNLRPVEQGFPGIRFDAIPGAHRIVVVPSSSGWRMAMGVPELTVLTAAGFYAMSETTFIAPDGEKRPAREYRLTKKGYLALSQPQQQCYDFVSFGRLELVSSERTQVPERLSGLGEAYRAKFRIHYSELYSWAQTPEFRYVFTKVSNLAQATTAPLYKEQIAFFQNGRWFSEREAMMGLMIDAAALRAESSGQVHAAREKLAADTPERRAARLAAIKVSALREQLALESNRPRLEPCLDLPVQQADLSGGFWKKDIAPTFVLYDLPERRDVARYEHAADFLQRLQKARLAKSETFEGEPFRGARAGKGLRFILDQAAAASLEASRPTCLPLGVGRVEEIQLGRTGQNGIAFRGWVRLSQPRAWTAALAAEFPNVRTIVDQGFGVIGTVSAEDGTPHLQLQLQAPAFAPKQPMRPIRLEPLVVRAVEPTIVDQEPGAPVRMAATGCAVSVDGTEVSGTLRSCTQSRASRAFRSGKAYAEITFQGKATGAHPETWTNAAVTSQRSLYSLSTGASPFSFAGSFNKHLIKDGDVISLALDMDSLVMYWRLNGQWMTGRPGTGLGEPMLYPGDEYFIAVSVQDKAEAWRINFGATPFHFSPPDGFPSYGGRR
jgi:hypothetical protein